MSSAFDSPDTVQLKGKVTGVTRLSRKAKGIMLLLIFVVVGFILFSIVSMDDGTETAPAGQGPVAEDMPEGESRPETVQAKPNFEHVGDGQAAVAAQMAAAAAGKTEDAPSGGLAPSASPGAQSGQNVGPGYNVGSGGAGKTPPLTEKSLGAAQAGAGMANDVNGTQAQSTSAGASGSQLTTKQQEALRIQIEAQRIAKERADSRDRAIRAPLEAESGGGLSSAAGMAAGLDGLKNSGLAAQALLAASGQGAQPGSSIPALNLSGAAGQQDDPNKQRRKEQFMKDQETSGRGVLKDGVRLARGEYEVQAGWAIPASLQCAVNSDVPGQTCARVTEDVYDSVTGKHLLIPRNSRLVGTYDSQIAFGQERLLVAFTTLFFPDGSSISLEGMPGADKAGNAGFDADVNNHYAKVFGGAAFMAAFSAGVSLTQKQGASINGNLTNSQVITQSLGQQLGQTGTAYIQRGMNVQPTLSRAAGYKFNVMVTRSMLFPGPYQGKRN
ncbi:TrbI/VirB10 family protein [Agrobacterium tumefaciens]|uniref:TrbI/VirB10 family protein n=1 Tax=Agrobacterium tumefaciens TaxID=358 RepID=UPI0015746CA1|nr:TrbI/VirB10 family protein [Agrobacterium tumefaciens]NTB05916.1 TrbI/VirB10 family protein [Agrobacterium tumefaciens]